MEAGQLKRLIIFLLALIPALAMATIMLPLSLEKLTNESDLVVLGNCTGKNVFDQGGKFTPNTPSR